MSQIHKLLDLPTFAQFETDITPLLFASSSPKPRELLLSSLSDSKSSQKTPCNRRITPNSLSFECFDCAIDLECHIICEECFTKTDHTGHKVRYFSSKAGLCDCGNLEAVKLQCPDHSSLHINDNTVKEYIPHKIKEAFEKVCGEILWELLRSCENQERPGMMKEKDQEFLKKTGRGFGFFLKHMRKWLDLRSPAMDLLIIGIFMRVVKKELWHKCNNYMVFEFREKEPASCECTVLEAIFRLNICLKEEKIWQKIMRIIEDLMKYPDFRRNVAMTYSKYWNFIVYIPKYPNISSLRISHFLDFYPQFFTQETSEIWLKSHHFLIKLIEKTGDIIDCFFTSLNVAAYNAFDRIKSMFFFILKRPTAILSVFCEPRILETFLEIINKTHNPKNLIEEDNEKCRLHIECILMMIFKSFLGILLRNLENKAKSGFFDSILGKLFGFLKEIYQKQDTLQKNVNNKWPLHNTLQRSLTLVLLALLFSAVEGFPKVLAEFKPGFHAKIASFFTKNNNEFFSKTVQTLLVSVKFSQEKVKPVTFYEMFDDPFEGMKREVINGFYKKSYYLQNDYDMSLLQLLLILSPSPNDFLKSFSMAFDIDLPQIFFKASEEAYKKNLRSFLANALFLIKDEVSLLNASGFIDSSSQFSSFRDWTLKSLVINSFHNGKVKDLKSLKSLLYDKVLSFDIDLGERVLKELAVTLPQTTILRLRPEVADYYDPNIFYKYPKLTNDCYDGIKKLSQKSANNDLLIGNELPNESKQVFPLFFARKALFSSDFARYLSLIFKIEAFSKVCDEILKNSIKLLYVCLKTVEEAIFYDKNGDHDELLANYRKYFQIPEFISKLELLKQQKNLIEIKPSLNKVTEKLKLVQKLLEDYKKPEIDKNEESKEIPNENPINLLSQKSRNMIVIASQKSMEKLPENGNMEKKKSLEIPVESPLKPIEIPMENPVKSLKSIENQHEIKMKSKTSIELPPIEKSPSKSIDKINIEKGSSEKPKSIEKSPISEAKSYNQIDLKGTPDKSSSIEKSQEKSISNEKTSPNVKQMEKTIIDKSQPEKKPAFQKKHDKLKRDFLEKQKAFLQKNPSFLEEMKPALQNAPEVPTCFYCHDNLTVSSSFGVLVYITSDSLTCRSNGKLSIILKKPAKTSSSFSLTSCLHYVHRECNDKMQKNNLKALLEKKVLYTSILESLCGNCKALNNLFVFFNEEKVLSTRFSQLKASHLQLDLSINSIRDILKQINLGITVPCTVKPEFLEGFSKESQEFFDLVLRIFLNCEELEPRFNKSEIAILEELILILRNSSNNVSLNGLSLFIKRNRPIYRNVYLMFREYFWAFQCKDKIRLVESLKKEADESLEQLFIDCKSIDLEELDQKAQTVIWTLSLFFKNEDSTLYLMISRICRQIFLIFLAYFGFSAWYSLKPQTLNGVSFDEMKLELVKNSEFRSFICANMTQIARKLIGNLTVIFRFDEGDIKGFSPEHFLCDEEEVEFYAKNIDSSIFSLEFPCKETYFESFMQKLLKIRTESDLQAKDFLEYYPLSFHILALPRTYGELQQVFGLKKCELCGDFSVKGLPYLCLICGIILCSVDCRQNHQKNEKNIGNLNSHARSLHAGKGGFMNLRSSLIILMNHQRSISWGNLYKDEYGESVNERTWKWERFVLDNKMYGKIQDMMIGKRVPQEICYKLMENEENVVDVDYL